jgi:2,3-dihydroxy-p-cumate/2,3-dihydroxybenzoate 3,4-dioxygenase
VTIVQGFGYLAIGVADLREAVEFYSRFVRLDITEVIGSTAFMTGGLDHHWLRLEEGNGQGVKRIGYTVVDEDALAEVRAHLKEWGIEYTEGGDLANERIERWLRFVDPGGAPIELFTGMVERGVAPVPSGLHLETFLHGGWSTANFDEVNRFYREVLGFKISDRISDRVAFYRAGNRYHHSLALLRAPTFNFNHFCIQVASLDDVMRFRSNAMRHGIPLRDDILKHAPSGSVGVYMKDEARGFAVEFCIDHPQIDDENYHARILPAAPESRDIWQSPLPEPSAAALL